MSKFLLYVCKGIVWASLVIIAAKEVNLYIVEQTNLKQFEEMAKKYNCQFMTPSASRRDVGMFQCNGKIEFMKIED